MRIAARAKTAQSSGGEAGLGLLGGAGGLGGAHVDGEEHGEVAVFAVAPHEGLAGTRVRLPVDGTDIVPDHIGAKLVELDAAPPEDGVVFAQEEVIDETAGAQFDSAHAAQELRGGVGRGGIVGHSAGGVAPGAPAPPPPREHGGPQGTSTASSTRSMRSSVVISSASAS